MTVKMLMAVFWVVTSCGVVGRYRRFGGTYCLLTTSPHGITNQKTTFEVHSIQGFHLRRKLPPMLHDDGDSQFPKRRIKNLTTMDNAQEIVMFMTTHCNQKRSSFN
jgi:hypothetical protein